ncbi:MAG: alanine--glyoxylate aminotransferase family protein [Verrucomicrobiota bacterium]
MPESNHIKLFSPGPVEVSPETFAAMTHPMIGHRGAEFQALYADVHPRLQTMFGTTQPVFLSTSSAWGVMEGALRNLVDGGKVLCCACGAFSDKWIDVAKRSGKQVVPLQVEWGQPIDPDAVRTALQVGGFDAVTLVHNETSTGVLNPLAEIAAVVREFEEVLLIADTVSSFSVLPTPTDELGIDVLLTGSQKALALPPGLALFTASERAFRRAETVSDRGYYFDFLEFKKNQAKDMTPSTPCISLIYALRSKLDQIFTEGLERRYERHARLNRLVHQWVTRSGFQFFAPEAFRSLSLTCIKNNREIDVPLLISNLRERHRMTIDGGYGKIKGKTFRISNMGDETEETVTALLAALDDSMPA